jgi:hemerythrin-like domain-containing protein
MNAICISAGRPGKEPRRGRHEGVLELAGRAHAEMMRLCERLEEVADSLPGNVDRVRCLVIAADLEPLMRGIHRFEEEALFPAYSGALRQGGRGLASVERLMAEHVEDECFAAEITEALLKLGRGGTAENPEALGFMLRGFFEAKRRHVAFEREHVLPMIGDAG